MLKYFSLILLGYPLLAFASTDALDDKTVSQPSLSTASAESSITSTNSLGGNAALPMSRRDFILKCMREEEELQKLHDISAAEDTRRINEFYARTGKWPWHDGRAYLY